MLCPTCPKRPTCKSACEDLKRHLLRIERPQIESVKTPWQIEGIELRHALRSFFGTDFDQSSEKDEPVRLPFPIDHERLRAAMEPLTDRQRECLQLFYWEGLSKKAIAKKLRLSRQTVIQHLQVAVSAVRENYLNQQLATTYTPAHRGERVLFLKMSGI